jgi:hypothetical protein
MHGFNFTIAQYPLSAKDWLGPGGDLKMKTQFVLSAALALALAAAVPASASITLDSAGDTGSVTFNAVDSGGNVISGVSGELDLTLLSTDGTTYVIDFSLENTTTNGTSRITAFGFDVDPTFDTANLTDSLIFDGFSTFKNLESVSLDFCAYAGVNCNGGTGDGLLTGATTTGTITFTFDPAAGDGITLDTFTAKYQSVSAIGGESARGTGDDGGGGGQGGVPEPVSWSLMILGFGGVGAMLRRRRHVLLAA